MDMPEIDILATDLDGTLVGTHHVYAEYQEFAQEIAEFRRVTGAKWIICTGRSKRGFLSVFGRAMGMGVRPDYLITRERFVHTVTAQVVHMPRLVLNRRIRRSVARLQRQYSKAFASWHKFMTDWDFGATGSARTRLHMWFRFDTADNAVQAADLLRERSASLSHVSVRHHAKEVQVSQPEFRKGLAVAVLARRLNVTPERVLAVGNGHNDLYMLNREVARFSGCPANSSREVMRAVHNNGGHIAGRPDIAGVTDILRAYRTDSVNSDLPADWSPPSLRPKAAGASGIVLSPDQRLMRTLLLFALAAGLVAAFVWFLFRRL